MIEDGTSVKYVKYYDNPEHPYWHGDTKAEFQGYDTVENPIEFQAFCKGVFLDLSNDSSGYSRVGDKWYG